MLWKYQDKVFVFITNDDEAKGPGYVTMIGEEYERDKIILKAFEYRKRMHSEENAIFINNFPGVHTTDYL